MPTWKKVFIRAAGFGAGIALIWVIAGAIYAWRSSLPPKPKPWDSNAITASYEDVRTEGDTNTIAFDYTLQNNTDFDFRINDASQIQFAAHLQRSDSLSFSKTDTITTTFPVYVPAHNRAHFPVSLAYPTPLKANDEAPTDVRHDFETKLAKYIVTELNNIDGFVLLNDTTRYEIKLPDGWHTRAKEALRVKAPGTSQ